MARLIFLTEKTIPDELLEKYLIFLQQYSLTWIDPKIVLANKFQQVSYEEPTEEGYLPIQSQTIISIMESQ